MVSRLLENNHIWEKTPPKTPSIVLQMNRLSATKLRHTIRKLIGREEDENPLTLLLHQLKGRNHIAISRYYNHRIAHIPERIGHHLRCYTNIGLLLLIGPIHRTAA